MPIPFSCPCGRALRVKDELAGRRIKCPACGETITVPDGQAAADGAAAGQALRNDPWADAPSRDDRTQGEAANAEELSEVLPADSDEEDEEIDEDELSTRERVRRKEEQASERAAEREAERKAKDRKKRRNEKRFRTLAEKGRYRIHGSGRGAVAPGAERPRERWLYNVNAGIGGGIAMIVLAIVCSGLALKTRGVFFFTPVLFVIGVVALIKGIIGSSNK